MNIFPFITPFYPLGGVMIVNLKISANFETDVFLAWLLLMGVRHVIVFTFSAVLFKRPYLDQMPVSRFWCFFSKNDIYFSRAFQSFGRKMAIGRTKVIFKILHLVRTSMGCQTIISTELDEKHRNSAFYGCVQTFARQFTYNYQVLKGSLIMLPHY